MRVAESEGPEPWITRETREVDRSDQRLEEFLFRARHRDVAVLRAEELERNDGRVRGEWMSLGTKPRGEEPGRRITEHRERGVVQVRIQVPSSPGVSGVDDASQQCERGGEARDVVRER